jgi:dTDP-4-amino-4,6-dideoxygalactose transaminase
MDHTIPLFKVYIAPENSLIPAIKEVLYGGNISEGEPVYDFEKRFSEFVGHQHVLATSSGTAALHTALYLAGVGKGDEVISTAMTAEPTNMAILHAGAEIVWADVDPFNGNISPESIKEMVSERTKAIMVVHYGGIPASMNRIRKIAEQFDIAVIEDAAHALGAFYNNHPIGLTSEYTMFSLQAIKHMTTVDGGMLACKDPDDIIRGRAFRWFGIDRQAPRTEVDVKKVGYKYNMNNVNATIGLVQLEHITPIIARHIANGRYFDTRLTDIPAIELCHWDEQAEPSYWFYTILAERRDDLSQYLTEHGVGNSQVHRRNDQHSVFSSSHRELPGLDRFYSQMLHIPCGWWVSDEQREFIAETIRKGW